jgi:hypothetical protein
MLAAHISEKPIPLIERQRNVPPQLNALVMQCLEKHADNRPENANEIITLLDQIQVTGEHAPADVADVAEIPEDPVQPHRPERISGGIPSSRWYVIAAIAVAVTVIVGVLIGRELAGRRSPDNFPSPPGSSRTR